MKNLGFVIDSLDGLPESIDPRSLYKKTDDGSYVLQADGEPPGFAPASRLAEFRTNNRAANTKIANLETQIEELTSKLDAYKGIDLKEVERLKAKLEDLEKVGAGAPDDIKALIRSLEEKSEKREKAMREQFQKEVSDLRGENERTKAEREQARLESARRSFGEALATLAIKSGVQEVALDDVKRRAATLFAPDKDLRMVAQDENGNPILNKNGDPLTPEEWLKSLTREAPYFFKATRAGGVPDGGALPAGAHQSEDVREIPESKILSRQDLDDIKAGKAVRVPAVA
jgi:hypothetical protein